MGKSRLLAEVAAMACRLSIRVGGGVAEPGDTVVQLSPLMEALFEGPCPILDRDALDEAHTSPEQRAPRAAAGLSQRLAVGRQRYRGRFPRAAGSPFLLCHHTVGGPFATSSPNSM